MATIENANFSSIIFHENGVEIITPKSTLEIPTQYANMVRQIPVPSKSIYIRDKDMASLVQKYMTMSVSDNSYGEDIEDATY